MAVEGRTLPAGMVRAPAVVRVTEEGRTPARRRRGEGQRRSARAWMEGRWHGDGAARVSEGQRRSAKEGRGQFKQGEIAPAERSRASGSQPAATQPLEPSRAALAVAPPEAGVERVVVVKGARCDGMACCEEPAPKPSK